MQARRRFAVPGTTMQDMSEKELSFHFGGDVMIETLADGLARFSNVLGTLSESHSADVRWVLSGLGYGSASVAARAVPSDDEAERRIPAMAEGYIDAARRVLAGDADLGFPLDQRMHDLMALADQDHPITVQALGREAVAEAAPPPLTSAVGDQPGGDSTSLGTVRGRVETLSRRTGLSFNLYELTTDSAVKCYMDPDDEETMRSVWGRVADVTGTVRRDAETDRPVWIRRVTTVEPVDAGDPNSYLRARGALRIPRPAEELVRQMRDAD